MPEAPTGSAGFSRQRDVCSSVRFQSESVSLEAPAFAGIRPQPTVWNRKTYGILRAFRTL